jgi:hypothetical protein
MSQSAAPPTLPVMIAWLFCVFALILFVITIVQSVSAGWNDAQDPCRDIRDAEYQNGLPEAQTLASSVNEKAGPLTVIDYYPKETGIGRPLCIAFRKADDGMAFPSKELHLYLNGLELKKPVGSIVDHDQRLALFDLSRASDDADIWAKIIGQPGVGIAKVDVGAGFAGSGQLAHIEYPPFNIRIYKFSALLAGLAAFVAAVISLGCFASTSGVLRDGDSTTSFSLGRVQMAVWLYLVTAAFLYIWLVTGDYNGIVTPETLTLLGISAATGLSAISLNAAPKSASGSFLDDILNDGSGVSLHRLQMLVWTIILAAVFLSEVYHSFRLPKFDTNLLILMGISGATYVGFKAKES